MVRPIQRVDNPAVASIIRTVMPEFGAGGQGFAIHDEEVDDMFEAYNKSRTAYYVCEVDGVLVGGGGIAQLQGGDSDTCELKKMYFFKQARGKGLGFLLLNECIKSARSFGYKDCYLETFNTMASAMRLYEKVGFKKIESPMGSTGHFACDVFYLLKL